MDVFLYLFIFAGAVIFLLLGGGYVLMGGKHHPYTPAPQDKRCLEIAPPPGKRRCWLEAGHEKTGIKHFEGNRYTTW